MSLMSVVQEINRICPELSPDNFPRVLDFIWADVVRKVQLPVSPSPLQLQREDLVAKRARKGRKPRFQRNEVYQAIAQAKYELDGGHSNLTGKEFGIRRDEVTHPIETLSPSTAIGRFPLLPERERAHVKKLADFYKVRFIIDMSLSEKIEQSKAFVRFLGMVESRCRTFASKHRREWEFTMQEKVDVEETEWKRIVLRVKPPTLPLEDIIQLWDSLDDEIRGPLRQLITSTPEATDLRDLEENLYIEMKLH